ncbi:hypothetical protein F5141DRAFT_1012233, partial [Pisolithus sp. B1]
VWGQCSHACHILHCLCKCLGTPTSKHQCPMDRRPARGTSPTFFPHLSRVLTLPLVAVKCSHCRTECQQQPCWEQSILICHASIS